MEEVDNELAKIEEKDRRKAVLARLNAQKLVLLSKGKRHFLHSTFSYIHSNSSCAQRARGVIFKITIIQFCFTENVRQNEQSDILMRFKTGY